MPIDVDLMHVGPGVLALDLDEDDEILVEATEEGGTLAYSRALQEIEIAEELGAVDYYIDGEEVTFTVVCRELDVERLKAHFGHGVDTTESATVDEAGYDELAFGGSFQFAEHTLTYTVPQRKNADLNIIIFLRRVVSMTEGELAFQKSAVTGIPMTFRGMPDLSEARGERLGYIRHETEEPTE
ncbi:MAG: hypothetical protein ACOC9Y_05000 [Chloroflexota bacterium]